MTTDQASTGGTDSSAAPPDDGWAPPTAAPEAPRRHVPALLIALVCVVALVGGTWWAGGFEVAKGRLFRLPVGTQVNLGPLSVSLDRALARQQYGHWTLYVFGHCTNNTDEALVSTRDRLARNAFAVQHPVSLQEQGDASLFFGPGETLGRSSVLNPGTPPVPCQLAFDFDDFPGTDFVSVAAFELQWIDNSPTGEGDMIWSAGRVGYRFEVPVVIDRDTP